MKISVKKLTSLFIFLFLIVGSINLSHGQIASWVLTSDGIASGVDANITAGDFSKGTGIPNINFSAVGASAQNWSTVGLDVNDYFQITLSPNTGYEINITDINFSEWRSANGILEYQVQWSKNADFSGATTIATVSVPDNESERDGSIAGLNIDVLDGETIYIRLFAYLNEQNSGDWRINDNSLNIVGTVSVTPTVSNESDIIAVAS